MKLNYKNCDFVTLGFFVLSSLVWGCQQLNFSFASTSGMTVPDSVNLAKTLQELWIHDQLFDFKSGYFVVAVIYGWTWLIHPSLCFGVNAALLLTGISLLKRVVLIRLGAPLFAVLGLLANPYLILAMPGPNKEIPLLLLTLLQAEALFRPNPSWMLALAYCVPIYLLRDGFGMIMFFLVVIALITYRREALLPLIAFLSALVVALAWQPLSSLIPPMGRNLSVYSTLFENQEAIGSMVARLGLNPFDYLGGLLLYFSRLVYNALSMALVPTLFTQERNIFWIGFAYWVFGLLILSSLIGCVWSWVTGAEMRNLRLAASLVISIWFLVSLSLFVQPRYLMPILPVAFGVLVTLPSRSRLLILGGVVGLSLSTIIFYALIGHSSRFATPEGASLPAYILMKPTEDTH